MSRPDDPEEVDRRFAELVRAEFGDEPLPSGSIDDQGRRPGEGPHVPLAPRPRSVRRFDATPVSREDAGFGSDDNHPDDDPDDDIWFDDDYRSVDRSPRSWPSLGVIGFALATGGTVLALAMVFGLPLPSWAVAASMVGMVTGVSLLLWLAFRRGNFEDDEPGGRL